MLFYIQTNQFVLAKKLVPIIESGLKKFGNKLPKGRILTIYYNIAVLFLVIEEFDECLTWINNIIFGEWENIRQDIQDSAKMLQIILHYELGNVDLLDSLMRSTRRHLKESERLYEMETLLLQLVKKLIRTPGKKERNQALEQVKQKISVLSNINGQVITGTEEILLWIESRLNGRSIADSMGK